MSDAAEPGDLFSQLISKVQAENADTTTVVGVAGGGAVTIEFEGIERVVNVTISDDALEDSAILGDLVAAAINHALEQIRAQQVARASKLLGGFNFGGLSS